MTPAGTKIKNKIYTYGFGLGDIPNGIKAMENSEKVPEYTTRTWHSETSASRDMQWRNRDGNHRTHTLGDS